MSSLAESILYYLASYVIDVIHTVKSLYSKSSLNPLSPKNEKQKFSPNVINASSNEKVMRIDEMITKAKILCSLFILWGNYVDICLKNLYPDIRA